MFLISDEGKRRAKNFILGAMLLEDVFARHNNLLWQGWINKYFKEKEFTVIHRKNKLLIINTYYWKLIKQLEL